MEITEAASRMVDMVQAGAILTANGERLETRVDTICVHGDSAAAVALAQSVRNGLESYGIQLKAFTGAPIS